MDNSDLLHYRVIGNGYPVVFLHGFLESLVMWDYFSFENNFQCILIDLPGHGDSIHSIESENSMELMAREVKRIIDQLDVKECAVVGHSMGGYVGLELMSLDIRCCKLVLLNSNFWQDSDLKKEDRKRVAEIVKRNKNLFLYEAIPNLFNQPISYDSDIKAIISKAIKMDGLAIGRISLAMAKRKGFEKDLIELKGKLLIIQGEFDTIVPKEKMKSALYDFPMIAIQYVNSGHMAHIEESEITQNIIQNFLK